MLSAKQGFLCYSCHGADTDKESKDIRSKHSPVVSGECTACHSPHKSNLEALLLSVYPDLCLSCHKELKAKMYGKEADSSATIADGSGVIPVEEKAPIYVHALSDLEKCQTCHEPHFSAEMNLIVEPIQPLCGRCHAYNEASFNAAHIHISADSMDCRNCHASHTSKSPKFFKDEIHKPFSEGSCKDCHVVAKR
jgi:predicted CXXCH cytochrome family protein